MTSLSKFLISFLAIVIASSLAFIIYKQVEIDKRQKAIESSIISQKEIGDGIVRSMSQYASAKDIESIIKKNGVNLDKINKDLENIDSKIDSINITVSRSSGYSSGNQSSSGSSVITTDPPTETITDCKGNVVTCISDPNNYFGTVQYYNISEHFSDKEVPFGQVGFSASKDKPWEIKVLPRDYKFYTVSSVDEDKRVVNYNKLVLKVGDKDYTLPIASATTTQVFPEPKFRFFSPRLFLGLDGGVDNNYKFEAAPLLSLGIMNYGKFNSTPDFSILQLGFAFDPKDRVSYFSITPFAYNIGKHLPFIENTYLGPSFYLSPSQNFAIMAGIRVGL